MTPWQENHKLLLQELEILVEEAIVSVGKTNQVILNMLEKYQEIDLSNIDVYLVNNKDKTDLEIYQKELYNTAEKAKSSVDDIDNFSKSVELSTSSNPELFNKIIGDKKSTLVNERNDLLVIKINQFYQNYTMLMFEIDKLTLK